MLKGVKEFLGKIAIAVVLVLAVAIAVMMAGGETELGQFLWSLVDSGIEILEGFIGRNLPGGSPPGQVPSSA